VIALVAQHDAVGPIRENGADDQCNCAGSTVSTGCTYASYLFGGNAKLISFRLISYDNRDNVGAGLPCVSRLWTGRGGWV